MRSTPEGSHARNRVLASAAANVGTYTPHGIPDDIAEAELTAAALACGLEPDEIERTVRGQLAWGRARPRHLRLRLTNRTTR